MKKIVVTMNHELSNQQNEWFSTNGFEIEIVKHPVVNENMNYNQVYDIAIKYCNSFPLLKTDFVFLQGEPTFVICANIILAKRNIPVIVATTKREAVETLQPDGSVIKTSVFKHCRFRLSNGVDNDWFY